MSNLLIMLNKLTKLLFVTLIYPLNTNYLAMILLNIKYFYYLIYFLIITKFNSTKKTGI